MVLHLNKLERPFDSPIVKRFWQYFSQIVENSLVVAKFIIEIKLPGYKTLNIMEKDEECISLKQFCMLDDDSLTSLYMYK